MSLDTATGEITGTPTSTGTSTFKIFAYNQYAASIKDVTINVIDLANWKYSMNLTMKYTGQGDTVDATRPGQGSVAASASNQQHPATRAFDDKVNDGNGRWLASAPTTSNPGWIRYDFTEGKKIVEKLSCEWFLDFYKEDQRVVAYEFEQTKSISSYLYAICGGPYTMYEDFDPQYPPQRIYVRQSLVENLRKESIFGITKTTLKLY